MGKYTRYTATLALLGQGTIGPTTGATLVTFKFLAKGKKNPEIFSPGFFSEELYIVKK
jgi:hypothetical protein